MQITSKKVVIKLLPKKGREGGGRKKTSKIGWQGGTTKIGVGPLGWSGLMWAEGEIGFALRSKKKKGEKKMRRGGYISSLPTTLNWEVDLNIRAWRGAAAEDLKLGKRFVSYRGV